MNPSLKRISLTGEMIKSHVNDHKTFTPKVNVYFEFNSYQSRVKNSYSQTVSNKMLSFSSFTLSKNKTMQNIKRRVSIKGIQASEYKTLSQIFGEKISEKIYDDEIWVTVI